MVEDEPKLTFAQKAGKQWDGFSKFMWSSEKGEIMGRGGVSWAKIGVFYLIFYLCLAGFFAINLIVMLKVIEGDAPYLTQYLGTPGVNAKPTTTSDKKDANEISFKAGSSNTYNSYTNQIISYLDDTYNDVDQDDTDIYEDCDLGQAPADDKLCTFRVADKLGDCATEDFGYDEGKPCVFLTINKRFDWVPEGYAEDDVPSAVSGGNYSDSAAAVACQGYKNADDGNLGYYEVYPSYGFGSEYYPYSNQENYLQPIVAVKFFNLTRNTEVRIICRVYAKNIEIDSDSYSNGRTELKLTVKDP